MYFTFEPGDVIIAIVIASALIIILPFIFKIVNYFRFKELCENIELIADKVMSTQIQLNKLNARAELTNMYLKELVDKNSVVKNDEIQENEENEEKKVL